MFLGDFAQPDGFALGGWRGLTRVGRCFTTLPRQQRTLQPKCGQFSQQAGSFGIVTADDAVRIFAVRGVALGIEACIQFCVGLRPCRFPSLGFGLAEPAQEHQRSLHRGIAGAEGFFRQADHGQQFGAAFGPAAQPGQ